MDRVFLALPRQHTCIGVIIPPITLAFSKTSVKYPNTRAPKLWLVQVPVQEPGDEVQILPVPTADQPPTLAGQLRSWPIRREGGIGRSDCRKSRHRCGRLADGSVAQRIFMSAINGLRSSARRQCGPGPSPGLSASEGAHHRPPRRHQRRREVAAVPPPRLRQRLSLHQPRDQPRPPRVPSPRPVVARGADGGEGVAGAASDELERHTACSRESRRLATDRRPCQGGGRLWRRVVSVLSEEGLAYLRRADYVTDFVNLLFC